MWKYSFSDSGLFSDTEDGLSAGGGVATLGGPALAAEILALNFPVVISIVKPDLVAGSDGPAGEEGDAREAQVLVHREHLHGQNVGLAQMVQETPDVPEEPRVDTVSLPNLVSQSEEEGVVLSFVCLCVSDDLAHVFADEGSLWNVLHGSHCPAHLLRPVNLQPRSQAVLDHSVPAGPPAGAGVITLKQNLRLALAEVQRKTPLTVVPASQTELSTRAGDRGAVICAAAVL